MFAPPDAVDPALLTPNVFVDAGHADVAAYVGKHVPDAAAIGPVAAAVALYYAVRDGLRYTPWEVSLSPEGYRASEVARRSYERGGHCIDKALLLAAGARALGIPSRLHFANVRNHIGTARLEERLGTDLLVFHGYAELYLEGRWVAATPAFNRQLCAHLKVAPLEWDGRTDSIFQEYDASGARFMEYVHDYGAFAEIPYELMVGEWRKHYPALRNGAWPRAS